MRFLKGLLWTLLVLFLGINLFIVLSGRTYLYKGVMNTYMVGRSGPDIAEKEIFPNRRIDPAEPQPWPKHSAYGERELGEAALDYLDSLRTASFLVVHRDSLLFEHYDMGFSPDSVSNSFSVAKSIVNVLTGIALRKGHIESIDEPVGNYLPRFQEGEKEKIRIRDLMAMRSGLNWKESGGNPFSHNAEAYYGNDLPGIVERLEAVSAPGEELDYQSGNTLILGMLLREATGRPLAEFAEEELWQRIGSEHPAYWNLDREDGMEKAFCCFYSIPRDFARIGKLYLHDGEWKGERIVDSSYVAHSTSPSGRKGPPTPYYGHFWWVLDTEDQGRVFYARGILGQYIIVVPEEDLIIVRTGRERESRRLNGIHPVDVIEYLEFGLGMVE